MSEKAPSFSTEFKQTENGLWLPDGTNVKDADEAALQAALKIGMAEGRGSIKYPADKLHSKGTVSDRDQSGGKHFKHNQAVDNVIEESDAPEDYETSLPKGTTDGLDQENPAERSISEAREAAEADQDGSDNTKNDADREATVKDRDDFSFANTKSGKYHISNKNDVGAEHLAKFGKDEVFKGVQRTPKGTLGEDYQGPVDEHQQIELWHGDAVQDASQKDSKGFDIVPVVNPGEYPNEYGYEGPVKKGQEIELYKSDRLPDMGEIRVNPELETAMQTARSKYAELTAKHRKGYIGRFLQGNSMVKRFLKKIPGVSSVVQGVEKLSVAADHKFFEKDLNKARQEYIDIFNALGHDYRQQLEGMGLGEATMVNLSKMGDMIQKYELEKEIIEKRHELSGKSNNFVNWWVNQNGFTGKLKKAGVIIGAGVLTGLTAGYAVPLIAGGLIAGTTAAAAAGGATGFGIGAHVTHKRASGVIKETGATLAQTQSAEDSAITKYHIDNNYKYGEEAAIITGSTESRTRDEKMANRARLKTATALGAAAGAGAFRLTEAARAWEASHAGGANPDASRLADTDGHGSLNSDPNTRPTDPNAPAPRKPGLDLVNDPAQTGGNIPGANAGEVLKVTVNQNGPGEFSMADLFGVNHKTMADIAANNPSKARELVNYMNSHSGNAHYTYSPSAGIRNDAIWGSETLNVTKAFQQGAQAIINRP